MNELIPVAPRQIGGVTMLTSVGRDLHKHLSPGTDFNHWIARRIEEYDFEEGKDFQSFLTESTGGRPPKEYIVSIGMAKELAMVERTPKGKEARLYYIECERRVLAGDVAALPTPKETKPTRVSERYREAAAIAQASIKLCKLMGMEQNMARVITADVVRKEAGIDCLPMLAGNIAVKEAPVTPTKLGEMLEPPLSAARVNQLLMEAGLQTRDAEKNYHLTEAGKAFGALEPFSSRTSKHVGHRVMWYERALEPLKQQMAKQSNVIPLQSAL
ncbi:antA/AntB antirepressor family protein [Delftia tsuruhatensis]|uniref:antA/AntB antirepressor family protein n=1 Tax=Delftia tsuruhatensis TaxID=180282 RepID=UPI00244BBCE3|nr:antA/AntB antirepressor family protein [Delftia tsuruhatensis]MDH0423653.1 antA/AntB antirepressor family protein [Delftia tsuruhatensis]